MQSDYLLVTYVGVCVLALTIDVRLPLQLHLTRQQNSSVKGEETCFQNKLDILLHTVWKLLESKY